MKKVLTILGTAMILSINTMAPAYAAFEKQNDTWKYVKKDTGTYAANEWVDADGVWYYFDNDGNMKTGWVRVNSIWYYLDPATGGMNTGWLQDVDGKWYYLDDATGAMLTKTRTPDGYYVAKNGVYNPDKGNIYADKKGPGINSEQEIISNMLKGVEFPKLPAFASDNLGMASWGTDGSQEALTELGSRMALELKEQGQAVAGDTVLYVDGNSITYALEGPEKPLMKLVKNGDHYELYDYDNVDKNMETILYAMCSVISSEPQPIYNAMYTVAQYDRTIMSFLSYKPFGDSQIMYTVVGNYDYFYFNIKAK